MYVELDDVSRSFGRHRAVDRLSLGIDPGEVHALLGPNGSGKTTTVRMIATLLRPDEGTVRVMGHDTVREAAAAKRRLGLVGQFTALDLRLTARENLTMFAELAGLGRREARGRAADLLERFELADAADRAVSGWSGGMRRRLDLLVAFVVRPSVLLLDEPTTGLDPASRIAVFAMVRGAIADGTAVVLTTQYLEEADQLASRLTILDRGRVIAAGSPAQIKNTLGEGMAVVVSDEHAVAAEAVVATLGLRTLGAAPGEVPGTTRLELASEERPDRPGLADLLRALDDAGVVVDDIGRRRPTLDEAFLALTGSIALAAEAPR